MTEDEEFEFRYRYEQEQKAKTSAPASIPGAEQYDAAGRQEQTRLSKRSDSEKTTDTLKKQGKTVLGGLEGLAALGSGITGYLAALPTTAVTIAGERTPVDKWPEEFMSNVDKLTYRPKTDEGQKTIDWLGNDVLAPFGLAPYANIGQLGARASAIGRKKTQAPVIPKVDFEADLRATKEAAAPVVPQIEVPELRLESPIAADNRIKDMKQTRGADDWNSMEHASRAVDEEIAATQQAQKLAQEQAMMAEQAATHDFLASAQQTEIDDHPYGQRPANYGMTDEFGRVDENGIPIRADLSMEAQNLQDPLQRNLWGDELDGPTWDNGKPLTEALDSLPDGPQRDAAIAQLSGQEQPAGMRYTRRSINDGKRGQAGAIDPEVFKSGFRGINRFLSKLTDQPWVKEAFPASHWETNPDGTPVVLLHGTTSAFNDQPRGVSWEGLHAGYGGAATLKAAEHSNNGKVGYRVGNLDFVLPEEGPGSGMYPVVVRKGNYPRLAGDYGSWEPTKLAQSRQFQIDFAKATKHGVYDISDAMDTYVQRIKNAGLGPVEENLIFSKMLKDQFGVSGFRYPNVFESAKRKLMGNSGILPTPQRGRNLATALKHEDSIVTYDDNNIKSLYDNSVQVPSSNKFGQRGGIDIEAVSNWITGKKTVGGAMSGKLPITGAGTPMLDSVQNPISPATIAAKRQLANAEKYARLGESQYGEVKTIEELRSILTEKNVKDINPNPVRDYTISGVEGMVRNFPNNPILKFVRSKLTDARNNAAKFETEYVTGENGINRLYRKMNKQEWADVSEALQAAGRQRVELTPEAMSRWNFNDNQQAFVLRLREALDAMHVTASEALTANGMKGLDKRAGYVPSMFSGAYTSLVGHVVKDAAGKDKFIVKGIAQGDTKAQHAAALEHYKKQGTNYATVVALPTRMLSGGVQKSNRVFDGFNDLVNAIAENDKDFAEIKALADSYAAEKIRSLNEFNVHEKRKMGVQGSLGDRPWLTRDENAKQFLEGLVNYMDEGARYYNYQNPLHQVTKIMNDPLVAAERPNTMKYLERYVAHVTGQSVGAHGKALNQVWNVVLKGLGSSPQNVSTNIHRLHGAASAYMMGLWNPAFAITQMVQPAASGIPEAIGVNAITETGFSQAMARNMIYSPLIDAALSSGNAAVLDKLPPHLVAAFKHAQDIGMTAFSESELTREVLQSKTEKNMNAVLHAPSQITERATRPFVFLTYVDMFHQAGFDADTSYRAAQYATDFAMTNYHPDERPMLYATFGHTGNFMGALTTYKHNLGTGMWTRGKDAAVGRAYAPMAAATVIGATLYGVSGIAGYQEMDELVQAVTGKTIKETIFPVGAKLGDNPVLDGAWHGYASTLSGYDFQSRLSMASALPDTALDAASPQLGVFVDIGTKVYDLIKNQDEQGLLDLQKAVTPVGMKGIIEDKRFTDPEGFLMDASGKRKFDEPRTPQERMVRKIIGLRPLRERLEGDDLYADTMQSKKNQEKLNNNAKRFKDAILRNDEAGIDFHYNAYVKAGGDPSVLFNDKTIAKWLEDSIKSQRERQQGVPAGNMGSMRKFEEYND